MILSCHKSFIGKDHDAGRNWRQKKEMTEDELVRQHHWLNGYEFQQTQREWRKGKPGVLQSMESQRVRHDLATEQLQTLHSPSESFSSQEVQTQSPYHSPASHPTMSPAPAGSSSLTHSTVLPLVTRSRTQQYPQPWAWALAGSSNTVSDSTVTSGQTSHQRRLPLSKRVLSLHSSHLSLLSLFSFTNCLPLDRMWAPWGQGLFLACSSLYPQHTEQYLAQRKNQKIPVELINYSVMLLYTSTLHIIASHG